MSCQVAENRIIMRFSLLCGFDHGRSIMFHALGHHRAYGVALLVVLASSLSFAEFMPSDSQNLYIIRTTIEGPSDGISIWATLLKQRVLLEDIESDLSSVPTISSDVATIKQYLDFNLNGHGMVQDGMYLRDFIAEFNRKFFKGVDRYDRTVVANPATVSIFSPNGISPFVEPGKSFRDRYTAQMAVTNIAETYWLNRINNSMRRLPFDFSMFIPMSVGPTWITSNIKSYFDSVQLFYQELENGDISSAKNTFLNISQRYGPWKWDVLKTLFLVNPYADWQNTNNLAGSSYNTRVRALLGSDTTALNLLSSYRDNYYNQYSTLALWDRLGSSGISSDVLNPTNFFSADGSIENTDNAFTNSETSVFSKFATSFLPSGMFAPDEVNTNLFEYVDSDISETPSFNPIDISGNGGLRSSSSDFDYDFDDSSGDYDYNLINPLKTATDTVQHDTDLDNKFEQLAGLVNQRITSIFQNPLNTISSLPARWQASLIDKDMNQTEDYVDPQYSKSSDGVQFVCWCCESMMFFGFFSFCVRRSLRVQQARDVASAI